MNITETISFLDELMSGKIKGADYTYVGGELRDAYPLLRQATLDGERYRKAAKILEDYLLSGRLPEDDCAALTLYRQAVERKEV